MVAPFNISIKLYYFALPPDKTSYNENAFYALPIVFATASTGSLFLQDFNTHIKVNPVQSM